MAETHSNNYVLGRGRLYFDKFAPGTKTPTGERYIGNTPELSSSTSVDTLDHYSSDQGLKIKDESIMLSNDLSLSFTTDDISAENIALFFLGEVIKATVVGALLEVEMLTVQRGLNYKLGVNDVSPQGTSNVTNVKVEVEVPPVLPATTPTYTDITSQASGNFDLDLDRAKIFIEPSAPLIPNGTVLRITYDQLAGSTETILGEGNVIAGALRFEAANPVGDQSDYYWPYVKISPDGDYSLKGDDWQAIGFTAEVLIRDSATKRVYITKVKPATP